MSDSEDEASERQYKIVLVGDQQVGKTAIAHRSPPLPIYVDLLNFLLLLGTQPMFFPSNITPPLA